MSVCTAGYKGESPKGLVREGTEREGVLQRGCYREMGATERWVLQRDGYYREGEAPKGLKYGEITERG